VGCFRSYQFLGILKRVFHFRETETSNSDELAHNRHKLVTVDLRLTPLVLQLLLRKREKLLSR